jgi:hypothetical protein
MSPFAMRIQMLLSASVLGLTVYKNFASFSGYFYQIARGDEHMAAASLRQKPNFWQIQSCC